MFFEFISTTGYALEAVGVIIIVTGVFRATLRVKGQVSKITNEELFREFRNEFGRAMMLGLEFLVAGDIVRTVVVAHTLADIASLGLLVLIRTVLVFTIHLEVEGRWPWQPATVRNDSKSNGSR